MRTHVEVDVTWDPLSDTARRGRAIVGHRRSPRPRVRISLVRERGAGGESCRLKPFFYYRGQIKGDVLENSDVLPPENSSVSGWIIIPEPFLETAPDGQRYMPTGRLSQDLAPCLNPQGRS